MQRRVDERLGAVAYEVVSIRGDLGAVREVFDRLPSGRASVVVVDQSDGFVEGELGPAC